MKIKMTITIEYEVHTQLYPESATPEKILAFDLKNAKEDISSFLDIYPYRITGQII